MSSSTLTPAETSSDIIRTTPTRPKAFGMASSRIPLSPLVNGAEKIGGSSSRLLATPPSKPSVPVYCDLLDEFDDSDDGKVMSGETSGAHPASPSLAGGARRGDVGGARSRLFGDDGDRDALSCSEDPVEACNTDASTVDGAETYLGPAQARRDPHRYQPLPDGDADAFAEVEAKYEAALAEIEEQQILLTNLDHDNKEYEKEYTRIQSERLQLNSEYAAKCLTVKDLSGKLIALKKVVVEKDVRLKEQEKDVSQKKEQEQVWKIKYTELTSSMDARLEQFKSLRKDNDNLRGLHSEAVAEVERLTRERAVYVAETEQSSSEARLAAQTMTEQVDKLQAQCSVAEESLQEMARVIEEKESEMVRLRQANDMLVAQAQAVVANAATIEPVAHGDDDHDGAPSEEAVTASPATPLSTRSPSLSSETDSSVASPGSFQSDLESLSISNELLRENQRQLEEQLHLSQQDKKGAIQRAEVLGQEVEIMLEQVKTFGAMQGDFEAHRQRLLIAEQKVSQLEEERFEQDELMCGLEADLEVATRDLAAKQTTSSQESEQQAADRLHLVGELTAAQEELEETRSKLASIQKEARNAHADMRIMYKKHNKELSELRKQYMVDDYSGRYERIARDLLQVQGVLQIAVDVAQKVEVTDAETVDMAEVLERLMDELGSERANVAELRKSRADVAGRVSVLEREHAALEEQVDTVLSELATVGATKQQMEVDLEASVATQKRLQEEIAVLEETQRNESDKRLEEEVEGLRTQIQELEAKLTSENARGAELTAALEAKARAAETLLTKSNALEQELAQATAVSARAVAEVARLEEELDKVSVRMQDASGHVAHLEKELSDERHLYKVQLREVKNKMEQEQQTQANTRAMRDIDHLTQHVCDLQLEVSTLQGNLESTEDQLERALESLDVVEREAEERESTVVSPLKEEVQTLRNKCRQLTQERDALTARLEKLPSLTVQARERSKDVSEEARVDMEKVTALTRALQDTEMKLSMAQEQRQLDGDQIQKLRLALGEQQEKAKSQRRSIGDAMRRFSVERSASKSLLQEARRHIDRQSLLRSPAPMFSP